jgi:hypothetical protein
MERRFYRVTENGVTADPVGFITLLVAGSTGSQSQAYSGTRRHRRSQSGKA